MKVLKVLFTVTLVFLISSNVTAIEIQFYEEGAIYESTTTFYDNGEIVRSEEAKAYIWGLDFEGFYKYSFGPYYKDWYMEIKQEGNYIIIKPNKEWLHGKIYFVLEELDTPMESITANGIKYRIDSVTVKEEFESWDGKIRTALVHKTTVADGTMGYIDKPENGSYALHYMTIYGSERIEYYSPDGQLEAVNVLENVIVGYNRDHN